MLEVRRLEEINSVVELIKKQLKTTPSMEEMVLPFIFNGTKLYVQVFNKSRGMDVEIIYNKNANVDKQDLREIENILITKLGGTKKSKESRVQISDDENDETPPLFVTDATEKRKRGRRKKSETLETKIIENKRKGRKRRKNN